MDLAHILVIVSLLLTAWAAAGCWILQLVAYPTYFLVGKDEFVPFHVDFGRRLIPVFVVQAVLGCLTFFALLAFRPASVPLYDAILASVAGAVILGTTGAVEVPTHMALDKEGKDDAKLASLVRWNLWRAISWTVALGALTHALLTSFSPV
ncbi:MAG: hypothetical protein AB7S26_13815 [Sandaracinaceae bacterium]